MPAFPNPKQPSPNLDYSPKREQNVLPPTTDWRAGYVPVSEQKLQRTGLRGKRLFAVVFCVVVLWILAITTFICNILLLLYLRMGPHGLDSIQFVRSFDEKKKEWEHVVEFKQEVELSTVVTNGGYLGGYKGQDLNVSSTRVIMESNLGGKKKEAGALVLEDGRVRAEGFTNFMILDDSNTPLFSAKHPRLQFSKKSIHQITASQIITNKVRSPIDSKLRIQVENMTFRGNKRVRLQAKTIRIRAQEDIVLRASNQGAIWIKTKNGLYLSDASRLPLSPSPSMTAEELGRRLCVCGYSHRVFSVEGNKPCTVDSAWCN